MQWKTQNWLALRDFVWFPVILDQLEMRSPIEQPSFFLKLAEFVSKLKLRWQKFTERMKFSFSLDPLSPNLLDISRNPLYTSILPQSYLRQMHFPVRDNAGFWKRQSKTGKKVICKFISHTANASLNISYIFLISNKTSTA